ncbi:LysM peptidoglycan-binding domain-containing protein [Streptosporangium sp. NBC_01469]|uniref:LysM peptidoglycan-binding domain-containing protein n=1 Tax=Streptosporangium sp. NBC_01469 TaxID=2903898 RepID=UPI002E2B5D3C|nr:LysM peptidoglycan-binding domain-containing protein [Streptosporangium sp. NBC_01469]
MTVLALFTLAVLWIGGRIDMASAGERAGLEGLPRITVHAGDTLWEIADALTEEADTGPAVRRIMDLNGLSGSEVRPGDRLYLPEGLVPLG